MAICISTRHTTSHANREIGVGGFQQEIIFKRRKTIHLVIFGHSSQIRVILISDNSGASGSSVCAYSHRLAQHVNPQHSQNDTISSTNPREKPRDSRRAEGCIIFISDLYLLQTIPTQPVTD